MRVIRSSRAQPSDTAFDGSRPLRVVLDDALGADEASDLLRGFSANGGVEVWSTAPSDGVGRIEIESYDLGSDSIPYRIGSSHRWLPVARQWDHLAGLMASEGHATREDAYRLLVLAQVARDIGADVLGTRHSLLLETAPRGIVKDANPMTPEDGVALMGLYLRLVGDFTVYQAGGFTYRLNRGLWYWVLTRDLLRSGWRWFSACLTSSRAADDDTLTYLGQSTLRRFDRALRARDRILQQAQLTADNDTSDEAIFYLDVALLMISGAFDAAARVAHLTYDLKGGLSSAGWRRRGWQRKVVAADREFASLLADGSRERDVMDLIGLLRNTIHGAGLQGIAVHDEGALSRRENLVWVPKAERDRLIAAMERNGGPEAWGVRPLFDDEVALAPERFIESLVPATAEVLNRLMDATDVGRLEGVDEASLPLGAPDSQSEFAPAKARWHRVLAGLA